MCTNLLRGAQLPYTHTHTQLHHLNSGSHGQLFYPSFSSKLQSEISCRYLYLYTNNEIDIFPPPPQKKNQQQQQQQYLYSRVFVIHEQM